MVALLQSRASMKVLTKMRGEKMKALKLLNDIRRVNELY